MIMTKWLHIAFLNCCVLSVSSCALFDYSDTYIVSLRDKPQIAIQRVAAAAERCWFNSGNKTFKNYRLVSKPSRSGGLPQLLIVPIKGSEQPALAIRHDNGNLGQFHVSGPLLKSDVGYNITIDVDNWIKNKVKCSSW